MAIRKSKMSADRWRIVAQILYVIKDKTVAQTVRDMKKKGIKISPQTIYRWKNVQVNPRFDTLERVLRAHNFAFSIVPRGQEQSAYDAVAQVKEKNESRKSKYTNENRASL